MLAYYHLLKFYCSSDLFFVLINAFNIYTHILFPYLKKECLICYDVYAFQLIAFAFGFYICIGREGMHPSKYIFRYLTRAQILHFSIIMTIE